MKLRTLSIFYSVECLYEFEAELITEDKEKLILQLISAIWHERVEKLKFEIKYMTVELGYKINASVRGVKDGRKQKTPTETSKRIKEIIFDCLNIRLKETQERKPECSKNEILKQCKANIPNFRSSCHQHRKSEEGDEFNVKTIKKYADEWAK
jgi:hypothetical protein